MRQLVGLFFFGLLLLAAPVRAQKLPAANADYLSWSATRRLTAADFQFQLKPHTNQLGSHAAFSFDMNGHVYDLFSKRGNDIIRNSP